MILYHVLKNMRLMIAYDDDCADGHTDNNDNNNDDDEVSRAGSGETEIRAKRGREKAWAVQLCSAMLYTHSSCNAVHCSTLQ